MLKTDQLKNRGNVTGPDVKPPRDVLRQAQAAGRTPARPPRTTTTRRKSIDELEASIDRVCRP
jgi:hypothetical protein